MLSSGFNLATPGLYQVTVAGLYKISYGIASFAPLTVPDVYIEGANLAVNDTLVAAAGVIVNGEADTFSSASSEVYLNLNDGDNVAIVATTPTFFLNQTSTAGYDYPTVYINIELIQAATP